jgi:hypothetical protein
MLSKTFTLAYAGIAYVLARANIAYIVGFLADFGVPKGINGGTPGTLWPSVAVNLGLSGCSGCTTRPPRGAGSRRAGRASCRPRSNGRPIST